MVKSEGEDRGEPLYPNECAFVVKFRRGGPTVRDDSGQVEHVVSGRAYRFGDIWALVGFMTGMLHNARLDREA